MKKVKCPYCKGVSKLLKPYKCDHCEEYLNPYLFIAPKVYPKLKEIRSRKDLSLKFNKYLRTSVENIFGDEEPLNVRYYQVQGILHMLTMNKLLLGDATGIGKTLQSIGAYTYMYDRDPKTKALIVAPKSALSQWEEEFKKFTVDINTLIYTGSPTKREQILKDFVEHDFQVLICNYAILVRDKNQILDTLLQPDQKFVTFFDEAAAFKTRGKKTWHAVKEVSEQATGVYALTATPIKNKLEEIYSIYKAIHPNLFPGISTFQNQYCKIKLIPRKGGKGKIPLVTGYKNLKEFRTIIDPYYLGRKVEDIGEQLPELTFKDVNLEMTPKQVEKYREALTGLLTRDETGEEVEVTKLTQINYCQQIVNNPKLVEGLDGPSAKQDDFIRLVEEDFSEEKIIAYTRFRACIDILEKELKSRQIPVLRVTGSENSETRELNRLLFLGNRVKINEYAQQLKDDKKWKKIPKNVQKYVEESIDPKVILLNKAGIEAINLQSARIMAILDTPMSYGDYFQLLGRSRRLNSKNKNILVLHFVSILPKPYKVNSIDQKQIKLVRNKKALNDALFSEAFEFRFEGDMVEDLYKDLIRDAKEL